MNIGGIEYLCLPPSLGRTDRYSSMSVPADLHTQAALSPSIRTFFQIGQIMYLFDTKVLNRPPDVDQGGPGSATLCPLRGIACSLSLQLPQRRLSRFRGR